LDQINKWLRSKESKRKAGNHGHIIGTGIRSKEKRVSNGTGVCIQGGQLRIERPKEGGPQK